MKCSEVRLALVHRTDGKTVDALIQNEIKAHLSGCQACQHWKTYHRILEEGPEQIQMPPFQLSPRVRQAIATTRQVEQPKAVRRMENWLNRRMVWAPAIALAAAIVLIAGYLLWPNHQKPHGQLTTIQLEGKPYQLVKLNSEAVLDPADLIRQTAPALQQDPTVEPLLHELVFLTDTMTLVLKGIFTAPNWEAIRQALKDQEIEAPTEQPDFLAVSQDLVTLLASGSRNVEFWVIQPSRSVLLFTMGETP